MNTKFQRTTTSCEVCNKRLAPGEGLLEENCGKNYCMRCISRIFLPYFLSGEVPQIVELPCGHYKQKQELKAALIGVCINCGFSYREGSDLQLRNDLKLCSYCFKAQSGKFQQFFWRCLSCDSIVQSWNVNNSDFVLCRQCSQSQLQIEQSIAKTHPNITKENSIISELKSEKLFEPFAQEGEGANNIEEPSEDLSIVSRFSALDVGTTEEKRHKGKLSSLRMHSKNSVEIRVENFELGTIPKISKNELIQCDLCNAFITIQDTLLNSTMGTGRICKICFAQNFEQSYLSYSRYNNYFNPSSRSNSLSRHSQITLLPPSNGSSYANPSKEKFIPTTITKVLPKEQKQPWEEQKIQDPCQICNKKRYFIIRIDKKKVCADCRNKK